MKAVMKILLE